MVQGTASSVGKSLLVAALCRIYHQRGLRVAPFKSQNMALNSFVTPDGLEIGRAQAVQAEAAGVAPAIEMNPILLKPERNLRSQVVLMGKPWASMDFREYHDHRARLSAAIDECLGRLRAAYDLVIIEGAGSPAEVNLRSRDMVNMYVARAADAPVILVGDIDRGGVFAHLVGTMELLEAADQPRVKALLINKFRGDLSLLRDGLDFLERRLKVPVLGVVPFIERLRIADEDSVALEDRRSRKVSAAEQLDIAVARLPAMSNYDDFLALEHEPGVVVRFVETAAELQGADLVILPGSKSTVADLDWLRETGIAQLIAARAQDREPVLGICGGCQMLGEVIEDPAGVESPHALVPGLGLLPLRTRFGREKQTAQIEALPASECFLTHGLPAAHRLRGYEIHMGQTEPTRECAPAFRLASRGGVTVNARDGAVGFHGAVAGTMLHGILEDDGLRNAMLRALHERRGLAHLTTALPSREAEYDRLAAAVRKAIDLPALDAIIGLA